MTFNEYVKNLKEDIPEDKRFETIVKALGYEEVKKCIPFTFSEIDAALENGDKYLNTLPLDKWSIASGFTFKGGNGIFHGGTLVKLYKKIGVDNFSSSEGVCILKECARMWVKEPPFKYDEEFYDEDMEEYIIYFTAGADLAKTMFVERFGNDDDIVATEVSVTIPRRRCERHKSITLNDFMEADFQISPTALIDEVYTDFDWVDCAFSDKEIRTLLDVYNAATLNTSDVEIRLINAMFSYAEEHAWTDEDAINALLSIGITKEDFCNAGYEEYVSSYLDDKEDSDDEFSK